MILQSLRETAPMAVRWCLPRARRDWWYSERMGSQKAALEAASQMARRRYGEPRLEIFCRVTVNSPDCVTRISSPAKAASLFGASKRWMSPISPRKDDGAQGVPDAGDGGDIAAALLQQG